MRVTRSRHRSLSKTEIVNLRLRDDDCLSSSLREYGLQQELNTCQEINAVRSETAEWWMLKIPENQYDRPSCESTLMEQKPNGNR